jgi:hypothetical protein
MCAYLYMYIYIYTYISVLIYIILIHTDQQSYDKEITTEKEQVDVPIANPIYPATATLSDKVEVETVYEENNGLSVHTEKITIETIDLETDKEVYICI